VSAVRPRLLSSDEATTASRQPTKPCTDCPFARTALNGWLGGIELPEWVAAVLSDERMDCHVHPNVQCAGATILRGNICKLPRDPTVLRLPADRTLVFSTPAEFERHHAVGLKGARL
jgi:hypothetical protein